MFVFVLFYMQFSDILRVNPIFYLQTRQ